MKKTTVRWLGRIVTDLSVPLEGLDWGAIKALCLKSKDDPWVVPYADIIADDAMALEYGMRSPSNVLVREVAVHVANRYHYYTARQKTVDPRTHRLLDDLLSFGSPSEGALPVVVCWDDGPIKVREYIGKYNFQASLVREHFDDLRNYMPYEPIATDRYRR